MSSGKTKKKDGNSNGGNQKQNSASVNDNSFTRRYCKVTFTSVNDKLIECERSESLWVCFDCSKLTDDEYKVRTITDSNIHWYCRLDCNAAAFTTVKT